MNHVIVLNDKVPANAKRFCIQTTRTQKNLHASITSKLPRLATLKYGASGSRPRGSSLSIITVTGRTMLAKEGGSYYHAWCSKCSAQSSKNPQHRKGMKRLRKLILYWTAPKRNEKSGSSGGASAVATMYMYDE